MKTVFMPVLCLALINISSCNPNAIQGSGVSKIENRNVGSFSRINLTGSPDVEVSVGPALSVSVTADDNIVPAIETTVSGNTLNIDSKSNYNNRVEVKVKITVPALDGASVTGSGDIHITGLKGADMETGVSGSGDVTLTGTADHLNVKITGSGDVRAGDLDAKHVEVTVTGSGDASVRATEELDATVTGSGDVHYAGNPPRVRKSVTGSGDINPR
jgi:hypothetical protein